MVTPMDYLSRLGLTGKQGKIYLDLAAHPESTVVQVHKRVSEPRSTLYLELERLIAEGYAISKKVGKSTYYKVTNPKVLEMVLKEKAEKLQFLTDHVGDFTAGIAQIQKTKETPRTINLYKGQSGIKQLLWNILLSKAELVVGFSPGQLEHVTDRRFAEKWREEFRDLHMHNKIIFNKPKPLVWSDVPGFLEKNVEARTLDEKKIKFDRMMLIYNDVLTVMSLKTDSDQYGIEVRDELLVKSFLQLFDFLWLHVAKPLKKSKIN